MKTPREIILKQHRLVEPRLTQLRGEQLAAMAAESVKSGKAQGGVCFSPVRLIEQFWREAIFPWRRAWATLAILWIAIITLNFGTGEKTTVASMASAPKHDPQTALALLEQRRLLAQLLETTLPSATMMPRMIHSGPRSERRFDEAVV